MTYRHPQQPITSTTISSSSSSSSSSTVQNIAAANGPPRTGSINGGNTFPGVSRPLGMVKLGPDLYIGSDSYSGYQPKGNFTGFTMLHEIGTGGAPSNTASSHRCPSSGKSAPP
ncbi:hypothetical protein C2857_000809 [Epichloe festucae Fl1]|uniref:Glycosyl hydrolase family 92 N-terminal domain-containing protein n=1 Tax=Epichloe festucae (strain Fl1) TaxID=877507 RepID=A0A7U3SNH0_EPIFF|nr:hypothetical protein C2857_000809 [Epichloe festucae Fl1]